jgi:hypothetical protein
VNGRIEIGDNSKINNIQSVNGRIDLGKNIKVYDDISIVNGKVELGENSEVAGEISTVNGKIIMFNARVMDQIETVNGDILLDRESIVEGDIIIKGKDNKNLRSLQIEIIDGSQVFGDIRVEESERDVIVYLSSDSKIKGRVVNARVIEK